MPNKVDAQISEWELDYFRKVAYIFLQNRGWKAFKLPACPGLKWNHPKDGSFPDSYQFCFDNDKLTSKNSF